MNSSLVSVIVTVYNQADYLPEALNSIASQTYGHWECIILNDGSTDDSESVALQYCQKDNRFSYFYQDNQGVVSARNNAVRFSSGKYVLPLDGDDLIAPDYLSLAVDVMENNPDVLLVICDVKYFGAKTGIGYLPQFTIRNLLRKGCCVNTSFFRRESFELIGGYKIDMKDGWEDWEFFISLMELKGQVRKIDKTLFYYRITTDSRNRAISPSKESELGTKVVSLHPELYYNEYIKLWDDYRNLKSDYDILLKSRSYNLYTRIMKVINFIMPK